MRTTVFFVVLAGVGFIGIAGRAAPAPAGTGAGPGELNLALTLTDFNGMSVNDLSRPKEPVSGGVPLPRGLVRDLSKLRVVDAAGKPVLCQFGVIDRWLAEPDPSVRWLLVDFVGRVAASESATYYLRNDGGEKASASPLKVTDGAEKVDIVTGPLRFTVSKTAFTVIDEAWFDLNNDGQFGADEQYIVSSPDNGGVVTSGDWPAEGYKAGDRYYSSAKPPRVFEIEENGPCRVSIRVDGTHHAREGGAADGLYDYRVRIQAYAGQRYVKVTYAITNFRVVEKWKIPPILNFEVGAKVEIPGDHAAVFLPGNDHMSMPPYQWDGMPQTFASPGRATEYGRLCSDSRVTLYQDSSGGDQWQQLVKNGYNARVFGGDTVPGVTFRGYKVFKDGKEEFAGNRAPGLIDVRDKNRGMMLMFRDFWQQYPKAMYGEKGRAAVKIFPEEAKRTFHVNRATGRTHELLFLFHGAKHWPAHMDWFLQSFQNPLLPRAPAEWYARCEAWDMGIARTACVQLNQFDKSKVDGLRAGAEAYGWISPWNPGGQHWNEATQFAPWATRGDGRAFQAAEVSTWWGRDLVPTQNECPEDQLSRFHLYLMGWNLREGKVTELFYPGYKDSLAWVGVPDSGHAGMLMLLEHYRLTGDRFSRDAVERLALRGRMYNWKFNYPTVWKEYAGADPDKDPFNKLMMSDNRYSAWPLFNFMQGVSVLGDRKLTAEARKCVLTYRNAVRYSPIGYMCLTINDKGSPEVYGRNYPEEKRGPGAGAVYGTFQFGLVVIAMAKYYEETGDEEARDIILATCDVMANRALLRDKDGRPLGWSYCWGDVWGPSGAGATGAQRGDWNDDTITALGYGYRVSGRADFLDVLKAGYEEMKEFYRPFSQVGYACVVHPREDQTPPAAVRNLAATALGNGEVSLAWTAPGGDGDKGRAAFYQIKHAAVKMVERVTDWPPPGVQMPPDAKGYRAAADAHRATICSFYQAFNTDGEPEPKPAGQKESFTLKGLPPGKRWIALKTFDAGPNTSELSNVVEVDVK
jgi:hypothetical protein